MKAIYRYCYQFNSFKFFLEGLIPIRGTRIETTDQCGNPKNLVWRNKQEDDCKISSDFKDVPLELSYFLLMRTRERMMLENRVAKDNHLLQKRMLSFFTDNYGKKALKAVINDLDTNLVTLQRLFLMKQD